MRPKKNIILGISAFYHDSSASLLINGELVAAAQEERFTRKKNDEKFPIHAIKYVLEEAGIPLSEVDYVGFYDKPYIKFERLLETYHVFSPRGLQSFLLAIPVWIKEKLFLKKLIVDKLKDIGTFKGALLFPEHHLSHAASAYYPSPFDNAAILTIDGVGEWATTTISQGTKNTIKLIKELNFPHSLGLLYSSFTYYCGFKVNSGEYKLMGLAPYGDEQSEQTKEFKRKIKEALIDIREDGSFLLNMKYFNYATGLTMTKDLEWQTLFLLPRRDREGKITQDYMNLALAIQQVTEEVILKLSETARKVTNSDYLVLAGGVALNCVANGKLLKRKIYKDIWIQPAAGDAGGSLGAAYAIWHIYLNQPKVLRNEKDSMKGSYLGPAFSSKDILNVLNKFSAPITQIKDSVKLTQKVSDYLENGFVVGWFQGRMEFGPRALGNRSILADPRKPEMQKKLNLKIKHREGFRPFAPAVLDSDVEKYFEIDRVSPYMQFVDTIQPSKKKTEPENYHQLHLYERLYHSRSDIPAVTHVDYSARLQTVHQETNPLFYQLLKTFKKSTNCSVLINTSFNVRGEPIVCTPEDAYRCFMKTEMDVLILNDFILIKTKQPKQNNVTVWKEEFELD